MNEAQQAILLSVANDECLTEQLAFSSWAFLWFAKILDARCWLEAFKETGCLDSGLI